VASQDPESSDICHTTALQSKHPVPDSQALGDTASDPNVPSHRQPHCGDPKSLICTLHVDIIGDHFWRRRPHLLQPSDDCPPRG
jgi:hypothetical protein